MKVEMTKRDGEAPVRVKEESSLERLNLVQSIWTKQNKTPFMHRGSSQKQNQPWKRQPTWRPNSICRKNRNEDQKTSAWSSSSSSQVGTAQLTGYSPTVLCSARPSTGAQCNIRDPLQPCIYHGWWVLLHLNGYEASQVCVHMFKITNWHAECV